MSPDVAAAKRKILSASEHFSQIHGATLAPEPPVGGMGGHPAGSIGQDSGGQVTIHICVSYHVVKPMGVTSKCIQQNLLQYIMMPSCDCELVFEVTGMRVEKVCRARHRQLHRPAHWRCLELGRICPIGGP